ncbi:peptidase family m1 containing protein [Stylonychia lemnae]|uniref:Peptidase family m1 containing protein n=1 Tax=Stylonychia lemnae TaxID=5949 RepID=A0A078AJJ7_STYLE|nr:peptidase family m1 containing protein [Stylonychia lemnae]|eukprot:CDW82535.1 peptidase family m1 containing protein [Stylonychia lemnae]
MNLLLSSAVISLLAALTLGYSSTNYPYRTASKDDVSYANMDVLQANHFELIVDVDFDKKVVKGVQTIFFDALQDVSEIVLDIQGLTIQRCTYTIAGKGLPGQIEANFDTFDDTAMGTSGLIIYMTDKAFKGDQVTAAIQYTINQDSVSVNWLSPAQTAGKVYPYMYTKCTAIHCRSIAPLQDSPSIKITYAGAISCSDQLKANMSAPFTTAESNAPGKMTYHFQSFTLIPSYLLAMAVGDLATRKIGARTYVISEPSVVDDYAQVFDQLEVILNKTESYMTPVPYVWGSYTVLVQPPSFPVGGMENPLLTFVSPSIMQKDKSQVFVAAHEIAHSWSGNLVTQRDWHNLWLNEGLTVFIERKVSGLLHGEPFAKIENYLGNITVWEDINTFGQSSTQSSLYPLTGNNPDGVYSELPYEKGNQFVDYLQIILNEGQQETDFLQKFLAFYINKYKYQSVTYLEFRLTYNEFVKANFDQAKATDLISKVDWNAWIIQGGKNPYQLDYTTPDATTFQELADNYVRLDGYDQSPDNYMIYNQTDNLNLKVILLQQLLVRTKYLSLQSMMKLDKDYGCTWDVNPEVGQRWFPLAIALQYQDAYDDAFSYVSTWGRQKYILPVYTALVRNNQKSLAIKWYNANVNFYHPIAAKSIRKIIFSGFEEFEHIKVAETLLRSQK